MIRLITYNEASRRPCCGESSWEGCSKAHGKGLIVIETSTLPLTAGAGTSRMLEIRGPMMISGEYRDPTMRVM